MMKGTKKIHPRTIKPTQNLTTSTGQPVKKDSIKYTNECYDLNGNLIGKTYNKNSVNDASNGGFNGISITEEEYNKLEESW